MLGGSGESGVSAEAVCGSSIAARPPATARVPSHNMRGLPALVPAAAVNGFLVSPRTNSATRWEISVYPVRADGP